MNGPQACLPYPASFTKMSSAKNSRAFLLDNLFEAGRRSLFPISGGRAVIGGI